MLKKILIAAIAVLSTSVAVAGDDYAGPVGYPGSTWGHFAFPSSAYNAGVEKDNWIYQGKITQGADWLAWGHNDSWVLDTYGSFGFSVDRNKLDYNNKLVPAIGVNVTKHFGQSESIFKGGNITFGVEGLYERHFTTPDYPGKRSGFGVQAYISYWGGWDLGGRK